MIFSLEALQADTGDCLILHYGKKASPRYVLIDGGPTGIFEGSLRNRLRELKPQNARLRLDMVLVSHIDDDHIHGILDLLNDLVRSQENSQEPLCQILSLWHNSFANLSKQATGTSPASASPLLAGLNEGKVPAGMDPASLGGMVLASVGQGVRVRSAAETLGISMNQPFDELVMAQEKKEKPLDMRDGLRFTVLGPHRDEIESLRELWKKEEPAAKGKGKAVHAAFLADYANRTAENLSSIVVLAEAKQGTKTLRMLLSGDCGGDLILTDLERRGLMAAGGKFQIDLMKVPHHCSSHSVTEDYFRRIPARYYVISGNGKHGNPHPDALADLSKARRGEAYDAFLTNRKGDNQLETKLTTFLASEQSKEPGHRYHFREPSALGIRVDLLEKV